MFFKSLDYPIVIVDNCYDSQHLRGTMIRELAGELRAQGQRVMDGLTQDDARVAVRTYVAASAILISIDASASQADQFEKIEALLEDNLARHPDLPVFLYGERGSVEKVPTQLVKHVRGYFYLFEDTKSFIARQVLRAAEAYMEQLLPPFFKALVKHTASSNYSWYTPGHAGGVAFTKSAVGRAFHQFFGENTLRSDLSISVPELGSLLDHSGPIKDAEAEASRNFGSDHTFFVTNGTSTANKIVWHGTVARGDVVVVDRNCHKSLLHSLIMTGAIPVYFLPSRNAHGIIGPISHDQFDPAALQARIAESPLASKAMAAGARLRIAVVTNSTYDGLCYNAEKIAHRIGGAVDYLHFDEAWYAYAAFHPFYEHYYGMAKGKPREQDAIVFTTHSTHKLLAAFSQASMIHVRDSRTRKLDTGRFNEAFMMHTTTSPLYPVIAACDMASKMMEGEAGASLVQEMHDESFAFRRAMLQIEGDLPKNDWWFKVWQPDPVIKKLRKAAGSATPASQPEDWCLRPNADWHGFGALADDFVLIDPIKVTLTMPGLEMSGDMGAQGIPAPVVSKFLWTRGIVVEKTNLYSLLILFSMGITKGKWGTLVAELMSFKQLYDANAPLNEVLPDLTDAYPHVYATTGLRDLCDALHNFNRTNQVPQVMREMYVEQPDLAMIPADAYTHLVRGEVEKVEAHELKGRIAATMLVPYPPGIPLIMPGERYNEKAESIFRYLAIAQEQDALFPGFESDIHGREVETDASGKRRYLVEVLKN
ncbi:arginine decarboxylase [Polaromonas sp. YR568]|uniref:Orn/Lys/Arg family decarboxylase n=1 Tax=Polaromonas sp. YR568 TaxID=1855301 RepID=UPI0008E641F3|nr:Orn/Lys/Arg decarboxylase N-terminal domain-containing protein [Polaromonas sp. YR568]SFU30951.1 arginine decarboxylase [Polaromonas sp. YR568]